MPKYAIAYNYCKLIIIILADDLTVVQHAVVRTWEIEVSDGSIDWQHVTDSDGSGTAQAIAGEVLWNIWMNTGQVRRLHAQRM